MQSLDLFLPCAAGVESFLADEVAAITGQGRDRIHPHRAGVSLQGSWRDAMALNLHSRLAQRVLIRLSHAPYRHEDDVYAAASAVSWEIWFTPKQTIKVEITAQHSPLKSLNFAALRVKDAVCDRLRDKRGERPSVDTVRPDVRVFAHLSPDTLSLYIDTSGEPLFKRGWREDKGDAPLKETLAAAMLAAAGWTGWRADGTPMPLYDPCCGSGTIAIEAAMLALRRAPGGQRRFGFEKLLPYQPHVWQQLRDQAKAAERPVPPGGAFVFGSDVAFRMVDFARRNAERAGVAQAIEFRGGDALQRQPPTDQPGVLVLNPPYGERIAAAGVAGRPAVGRESALHSDGQENSAFFQELALHWKRHYGGWSAWMLTPDLKLPGQMRLKESRRVPLWNGPIECRLFRFDLLPPKPPTPDAPRHASMGD